MKFLFFLTALLLSANTNADQGSVSATLNDPNLRWTPCSPVFPKGCEMALLQGFPNKKNSDIFLRVPGNYFIPPHSHNSAEHLVLIAGTMEVKYKGAAPFTMTPGTFAYGAEKLPHQGKCTSSEACVLYISFDLPIDAVPFKGAL